LEMLVDKLNHKHIGTVDNSQDALTLLEKSIPDLILMDVHIQGEYDGIELAGLIHQQHPIPIIFITSLKDDLTFSRASRSNPVNFLVKPFDKLQLQRSIQLGVKKLQSIENLNSPTPTPPPKDENLFLNKLQVVIEENLTNNQFGVPELAKGVQMSEMQVYRKLKALTDKTPSVFIRNIRLQKGKELLQNSDLTISEIAYDIGFSDPNYFSRTFQKEFGKSPTDFRK